MNHLVKILTSDSGDPYDKPKWHFIDILTGGRAAMCTQEFFGEGESGCEYKTKSVKKGGSNCPACLAMVRRYKKIRL